MKHFEQQNKMRRLCLYGLILLVGVGNGCSLWKNREAIAVLKDVAREREAQKRWVQQAQERFEQLLVDVQAQTVREGVFAEEILKRYGEPVLQRCPDERSGSACLWLYRHPLRYFDSDKVYLYFDEDRRLTRVVVVPNEDPS